MKKFVVIIVCMAFMQQATAQTNPKPGFIITNANDTIYGTIDYRSDSKNAYECLFKKDGESEYKSFHPEEISGYRFTDDGIFYVTRTFPVDGTEKTFFAEYLLKGGVSLYHHKENDTDYHYLVGEDGKVATVKTDGVMAASPKEADQTKRAALREASQMFALSSKARQALWNKDINSQNLTDITRDYDMEYCKDSGDCVQFQYDSKKARSILVKLRLQASLGLGINVLEPTEYAYDKDHNQTMSGFVPQIGVGADFLFPRGSQHWSLQALVLASWWNLSKEMRDFYYSKEGEVSSLKFLNIEGQFGVTYSFTPKNRISPVVRGGLVADQPISAKMENLDAYHVGKGTDNIHTAYGFYLGAGMDIQVGRNVLRVATDYKWSRASFSGLNSNYLAISAGIRL